MALYSVSALLEARVAVVYCMAEDKEKETAVVAVAEVPTPLPARTGGLCPHRAQKPPQAAEESTTGGESSESEEEAAQTPPTCKEHRCLPGLTLDTPPPGLTLPEPNFKSMQDACTSCARWNAGACKARPGMCRYGHFCSDCGVRKARHRAGSRFCPKAPPQEERVAPWRVAK
mmetsp:Transcript_25163/g.57206  ORF Transcript_25163/g.57206 Transcript_25163/m.57206 type:complete len:173 (+) Transcript_25163:183-701(+)